jgi:hypothetical protein
MKRDSARESSSRKKIKAWPLHSDGETELPGTKKAGTEALENQFGLSRNAPAKLLEE